MVAWAKDMAVERRRSSRLRMCLGMKHVELTEGFGAVGCRERRVKNTWLRIPLC